MSFEYFEDIFMLLSDLSVRQPADGIGTFLPAMRSYICHPERSEGEVVKASLGHYPLPFLISVPIFIIGMQRTVAKIQA